MFFKQFGRQLSAFIDLIQLDEDFAYQGAGPTLDEGIATLKDLATTMNTVERAAYFRTGKRCSQGPDLALTNPCRNSFSMLLKSFKKVRKILDDFDHLKEGLLFSSFTTLDLEQFHVSRKADQIQRQCSSNTAIKGDFETIALAPNKGLLIQEGSSNSLL